MASQNSPDITVPARSTALDEIFKTEIALHKSDFEYGKPLDLGKFSIAFHSADCPRCAYLTLKNLLQSSAMQKLQERFEHGK